MGINKPIILIVWSNQKLKKANLKAKNAKITISKFQI